MTTRVHLTIELSADAVISADKQTYTECGEDFRLSSIICPPVDEDSDHMWEQPCQVVSVESMTIEEKVANAVFYVFSDTQYKISHYNLEESYFIISEKNGNGERVYFDNVPADAYFLGIHRL